MTSIDKTKIVATSGDFGRPTDKATADRIAHEESEKSRKAIQAGVNKVKAGMKTETFFISPVVLKEGKK